MTQLRLELHDARLAARAGAQGARRLRGRRDAISCDRTKPTTRRTTAATPSPRHAEGEAAARRASAAPPLTIEGELVAKSTGTVSDFALGDRVFHQKFGNGNVIARRRQQAHHRVRQGRREARGG